MAILKFFSMRFDRATVARRAGLLVAALLLTAATSSHSGVTPGGGQFVQGGSPLAIPAACQNPAGATLSSCVGPDGDVTIGSGATTQACQGIVYVDKSQKVGSVSINSGGSLVLADEVAQTNPIVETKGIDIGSGGSLLFGSTACPIGTLNLAAKATLVFTGPKPTTCGAIDRSNPPCEGYQKGIQVENGGTLRMYGLKGVVPNGVSWTYLTNPAGPTSNPQANILAPVLSPPNIICLAQNVGAGTGAWGTGDWIAVATTSFSPWESEFVQIDHVGLKSNEKNWCGTNTQVTLVNLLNYYHFGGPYPGDPSTNANYTAGPSLNYGVDERAEVGLISRNILMTSNADNPNNPDATKHWGGELRVLQGFTAVSIQGVQFQKWGKEQLGSYPIHFHMDGDLSGYNPANVLVDSNSIDHSYNKCITVHSTQNMSFSNNVCARITGHIFYEEVGDETNISFTSNLGIGAMSNSFDVNSTAQDNRDRLLLSYYWVGDNLVKLQNITFNQFNIFNADSQTNPSHGVCGQVNADGKINIVSAPAAGCYPPYVWFEPPSGFWIVNPSAKLVGNSIAGCQDTGKAYWYVPPPDGSVNAVKWIPIGPTYPGTHGVFQSNRGAACYQGLYDENDIIVSESLFGYQNGTHDAAHQAVVDEFDAPNLTRMRDRGIWLRPSFYYVKDARIATTRDGASLVTSGGVDGNYPGVWGLFTHSVVLGMSTNNVDRWGPCGAIIPAVGAQTRGAAWGCIDQTKAVSGTATGGAFTERGYPTPDWPMFGFLIYDGPPLIVNDRFVNFRVDPNAAKLLTVDDAKILADWRYYAIANQPPYTKYEGDAALGWFNANQSSYPTATTTDQLSFTNVDLVHQVYTELVNRGDFTDGDKNTTIVDLDGTLAGVTALDPTGNALQTISLNNLALNASSNSTDECLAEGAEDKLREGRPTAAMVPSAIGQLEFETMNPPFVGKPTFLGYTQNITFTKISTDFSALGTDFANFHGSMALKGRNGLGDWEPKVTSGYGYTVAASPYPGPPQVTSAGFGSTVDVTITDTVNTENKISPTNPFYVQLGICYAAKQGANTYVPTDSFTITKGYRSYGGGNVVLSGSINGGNVVNTALRQFYNPLQDLYPVGAPVICNNLDQQMNAATDTFNVPPPGCPAAGIQLLSNVPNCPQANQSVDTQGQNVCVYPTVSNTGPSPALKEVLTIGEMTTNGQLNGPPNLNNYFYDKTRGMLFFWAAQTDPNAVGPSPLGNCTGASTDPAFCPKNTTAESYYVCPAEGCPSYRITLNDPAYKPGVSDCPASSVYGTDGYTWPGPPANQNVMVLKGGTTPVVQVAAGGLNNKFPHYKSGPGTLPVCQ